VAKWVIRRTIDGKAASAAMFCTEFRPILPGTGVQSVGDYIVELLRADERVEVGVHRWRVIRGKELVGFIDITETRPYD
jgi:hypothetical protein